MFKTKSVFIFRKYFSKMYLKKRIEIVKKNNSSLEKHIFEEEMMIAAVNMKRKVSYPIREEKDNNLQHLCLLTPESTRAKDRIKQA